MLNEGAAVRPRRSCLFMPGSNERALGKARQLPCDVVIIDLEDAVGPEAKVDARARVAEEVGRGGFGHREVVVRVNALDTQWGPSDIAMAAQCGADAVLLPKVTGAADIVSASEQLDTHGAHPSLALWVMIETPMAVLRIAGIAASATTTRLSAFVMGTNDLAKELLATATPDRAAFQPSLGLTLLAARAHGLVALDGVYNDIGDAQGLHGECIQGRDLGFDGKTLIHPSQIKACNTVFSPDPESVEHAQAIIDAFALPENAGKGVIKVKGKMTELLHLEQARHLVSMAQAIAKRAASD